MKAQVLIIWFSNCRLFAVCSRCRTGISASELVMRARDLVYHVACFTCASCGTPLNKGDHFGQRDGLVYCRWETGASDHYYLSKAVSPCYQRVRWRGWQEHEALCRTESFFLFPSHCVNDSCWVLMMVIGTDSVSSSEKTVVMMDTVRCENVGIHGWLLKI